MSDQLRSWIVMSDQHTSFLRIPLYKLYYLDEIGEEPLTKKELEQLSQDYDQDTIGEIVNSLEWASNNPAYPFSPLLPDLQFSDQDAYRYLVDVLRQVKRHLGSSDDRR